MIRKHIFFSGRVQEVGFRYRSYYFAQQLKLTGWVQNLYDGRVEMEVQGEKKDILALIEQLHHQRYIEIEDIEMEEIPVKKEKGFHMAN